MCLWGISMLGNVLEYQQSLRIRQTAHAKPCLVLILKLHWRLWNTHKFHDSLPEWGHFISCFVQISFQIFHHLKASLKHLSFQQPGAEVSQFLPPFFFSFLLPPSGVKSSSEGGSHKRTILWLEMKWGEVAGSAVFRGKAGTPEMVFFGPSKLELWAFKSHGDEITCLSTGFWEPLLCVSSRTPETATPSPHRQRD